MLGFCVGFVAARSFWAGIFRFSEGAFRNGLWRLVFLLGVGNLVNDNSLKWPQISKRRQRNNKQYTVATRYVSFIEKLSEFSPSKSDRKYLHTNSYLRRDSYYARWSSFTAWAWAACGETQAKRVEELDCFREEQLYFLAKGQSWWPEIPRQIWSLKWRKRPTKQCLVSKGFRQQGLMNTLGNRVQCGGSWSFGLCGSCWSRGSLRGGTFFRKHFLQNTIDNKIWESRQQRRTWDYENNCDNACNCSRLVLLSGNVTKLVVFTSHIVTQVKK